MDLPEFWSSGLRFSCTRCSHCCRHESGYVFINREDLDALCRHFGVSDQSFIKEHARWVPFGSFEQLSLQEKENKDCVFWLDGGCSVYQSRPVQCRTYPFWAHVVERESEWEREARSCPGIGLGETIDGEAIAEMLARRRALPPVTRSPGGHA